MISKVKSKNRTKFKIKGLNQEKLINNLIKTLNIYNFKRQSHDICEFEIDFSKTKRAKKMLADSGAEILSIAHFGVFAKLKNLILSYGIISGLLISSLFYGLQYSFVWKVEVYGESKVEERQVEEFIISNLPSKLKSRIDTQLLERKVKENFKEISSVSVAIVGQSLVLNLNEATIPEEMQGDYQPLMSEFDGLVTRINLIQGTLAVNEGVIVQKGDVLVYPYVIDSQGEERAVAPKAEIYADVWLSERVMHYDYQVIVERTGRKVETTDVVLNKLLIYSRSVEHGFKQFEVEEKLQVLCHNLLIPFKIRTKIYYETQTIEIKEDFLSVKDKIIDAVRQKTLIFLEENEIIKEEKYSIRQEGGCHEVSYVITVNRNIGG